MKWQKSFFSTGERASSYLIRMLPTLAFILVLGISGCQPLPGPKTVRAPSSGAELFQSKCSKCHDPELALQKNRTADTWRKTITRMKEEHNADITSSEIEILVQYHVERQSLQTTLKKNFPGNASRRRLDQSSRKRINALFLEKCSTCHQPTRALTVIKDPEIWAQTIKRMQYYSKGAISNSEADALIDFHITKQQKELNTFQETCTKCHNDERINNRSMSDEQWLATIKRMQQKAPDLITDEKVNLLAAYFHRRELALARIFYGKCQICHLDSLSGPPSDTTMQVNGLIVLANEEFGRSLRISDVNNLLAVHVQRQRRNLLLYENCATCHTDGIPDRDLNGEETTIKRTRTEWISYIAELQDMELTKEIQATINSQIEYHISQH